MKIFQRKIFFPVIFFLMCLFFTFSIPKFFFNIVNIKSVEPTPTVAQIKITIDYIVITETPIPTRKPTLTPTPKPTPIVLSFSELDELFSKYAGNQSVDKDLLKKIAYCESKFNPQIVNGIYGGLFQFSANTWISTRKAMNLDQNPVLRFHPEEAIKTAAFKLATAGIGAWPNCNK